MSDGRYRGHYGEVKLIVPTVVIGGPKNSVTTLNENFKCIIVMTTIKVAWK